MIQSAQALITKRPSLAQENRRNYTNPVIERDFPDPDVLMVGNTCYVYATNNWHTHIQVARSQDLVHWTVLHDAMPKLPRWGHQRGWTWAPHVTHLDDGRYLMYFTGRLAHHAGRRGHYMAVGIAEACRPEGPFVPEEEIFMCQFSEGGSIDLTSFTDDDGRRYLIWKNDGNSCGLPTWIYIQPVADDGVTRLGRPQRLFTADQPWEGGLIESPTLWKHNGRYYLFYSANNFASTCYGIGYAVANQPLGPYRKAGAPLLCTRDHECYLGPGGQDLIHMPDGSTWMLFHTWERAVHTRRVLNLARVNWDGTRPQLDLPGL